MAKYTIKYEDGIETKELHFKDLVMKYSMIPFPGGSKSDAPTFDSQYESKYPDADEELLEILYNISFDLEDILEMLEELEEWEY